MVKSEKRKTITFFSNYIYDGTSLGAWKKYQNGEYFDYQKLAVELASYVKEMGYTHIEIMPLSEYRMIFLGGTKSQAIML